MAQLSQVEEVEQVSQLSMQVSLQAVLEASSVYPLKQLKQTPVSQNLQLAILQMHLLLKRKCH